MAHGSVEIQRGATEDRAIRIRKRGFARCPNGSEFPLKSALPRASSGNGVVVEIGLIPWPALQINEHSLDQRHPEAVAFHIQHEHIDIEGKTLYGR